MRVSVVIPTLNRAALVVNCVRELLRAHSPLLHELIVIDQSDTPSPILASSADSRVVYEHVAFKNLPKARNYGTAIASGDLVLFLDDDVEALENIVDAHAKAHVNTGADVVTGPVLARGERMVSLSEFTPQMQQEISSGAALIPNIKMQFSPLFAPGCNASYRIEMLRRVGGFDENFIGSAVGEDAEMSHRVRLHGGRIIYDPAASIVHLHVPIGGCRDEADELRAGMTSVLNAHYFCHRIGRPRLMPDYFIRILRSKVLNRRTLATVPFAVLTRRTYMLVRAWWQAGIRTRKLTRRRDVDWLADKKTVLKG